MMVMVSGCAQKTLSAPQTMSVSGIVEDVKYDGIGYTGIAIYQVIFADGEWMLIGTGKSSSYGFNKIGTGEQMEKIKMGQFCKFIFEKKDNRWWELIDVEVGRN